MQNKTIRIRKNNGSALKMISRGNWLLLAAMLVLLLAFIGWFFFGTIRETRTVQGMTLRSGEMGEIIPLNDYLLTETCIAEGAYVRKGDVVARGIPSNYIPGKAEDQATQTEWDSFQDHVVELRSQLSGYVTSVNVKNYSHVSRYDSIATVLISDFEPVDSVIMLVNESDLDKIVPGIIAEIRVDPFSESEYGYLTGMVTNVYYTTESVDSLRRMTGNDQTANALLNNNNRYRVMVGLYTDDADRPLFSTGRVAPDWIEVNTPCEVNLVYRTFRPIDMILGN